MKFYGVLANGLWLNFRGPGGNFEIVPQCLTADRWLAERRAAFSSGEVVEFELAEVRRYVPTFEPELPQLEIVA